jgi:serine/threonine-protein kinase
MPQTLDPSRDLLFGLLALQNGLIDQGQLVAAFQGWTRDKARPMADQLVSRGDLDGDDRAAVEALVARHLKKHADDPERSLAAINAGRSTRESLARLGDADIEASLALVRPASTQAGDDADRTASYSVGIATSDGQRFRVLRPHARGGLGAVFVALDGELNREVALKQILDHHADDPGSRQRFLMEAEITGGLEHPGIVPVYGLGTYADGRPFYAMRFIRGDSLKEAIERFHRDEALKRDPGRRTLEMRKLLRRFLDVCNAIEYAHARGILHRDIKPGNIIVGRHGETLVVDWGLAKARGRADTAESPEERPLVPSSASGSAETLPGSALGTPSYMSPEQARGDLEHLGPQSDVYSLGATLYCLLTGRPPFEDEDVGALLRAVQRGDSRPPRQVDPMLDRALEAVCLKAMALNPENRYPMPRALAEDIERWMADEPTLAWREPRWRRLGRWGRRHKPIVAGAAALLVATVVGLSIGALLINRERARAEESFKQARQAVDDYFTTVSESKLLDVPGLQPLRKELLERALNYYQGFIRQRGNDRSVRAELAATFYRVARLTELINSNQDALAAHRQALALYEGLVHDQPDVARFQSDLAICCNDLGNLLSHLGERSEALTIHQRGLEIRERLAAANPHAARYQNELSKSHSNIGSILKDTGRKSEALQAYKKAAEINEKAITASPITLEFASDLGTPFNTLATIQSDLAREWYAMGNLLGDMDQPAEAIRSYQKSVTILEQVVAEHPEVDQYQGLLASVEGTLAFRLRAARRFDEALGLYQKAAKTYELLVARNPAVVGYHSSQAWVYSHTGGTLTESGRPTEGLPWIQKARAIRERLVSEHPKEPWYKLSLASTYLDLGRMPPQVLPAAEALDYLRRGEKLYTSVPSTLVVDRYDLACIRARMFPLIGHGEPRLSPSQQAERNRYEALAMETLRECIAAGYKDFENMRRDGDLDALRARTDFQQLIRDVKVARERE